MLSTFKPLNALYLKFEQFKILGRTFVRLKSGVPGSKDPLNPVLQNILSFLNRYSQMDQIFGMGRY